MSRAGICRVCHVWYPERAPRKRPLAFATFMPSHEQPSLPLTASFQFSKWIAIVLRAVCLGELPGLSVAAARPG